MTMMLAFPSKCGHGIAMQCEDWPLSGGAGGCVCFDASRETSIVGDSRLIADGRAAPPLLEPVVRKNHTPERPGFSVSPLLVSSLPLLSLLLSKTLLTHFTY